MECIADSVKAWKAIAAGLAAEVSISLGTIHRELFH
jgi:hypothetical protein